MKFGLMFANAGPFAWPDNLRHLAQTAERVGIESIWSVEHVVVPVDYKSKYPYSETGKMPGPDNIPIPDPIIPLAFAAAVTQKLRLGTGVIILPQRHPVYVAKEMATLDMLSNGRALLGVGSGWLQEEFSTLGIPFNERGARTNEAIRAIRSLWKENAEPFAGKFFAWEAVESNPKPVQRPGVPILVGGHSEAAAKRAARLGDGFFPARGEPVALQKLLGVLRDECGKIGRDAAEIEITTGTLVKDVDTVKRYRDLGVSRLIIAPPGFDQEAITSGLEKFAENIITRV
ncbi:MAG: LLM class F420-dependent oxidoreductase [Deltaproteobacteria bacterium]|nr:LLM class F420-dependent oxidoreductase [Deltaproteobacteria bacterium]